MVNGLSKRQLRYLEEQERKGRERWAAMSKEEQEATWRKFGAWFERRAEKSQGTFPYGYETLFDDAFVKARNLGLLSDPGFQAQWAKLELELRETLEEAQRAAEGED